MGQQADQHGERAAAEPASSPTWVSLQEAAQLAGVSVAQIRKWFRGHEIRARLDGKGPGRGRPRRTVVALEDVLAHVRARASGEGTSPEVAGSGRVVVDGEEWTRISKQLSDALQTHEALMVALERAATAEAERDRLRDHLQQLRRRVERLEGNPPHELGEGIAVEPAPRQMPATTHEDGWASEVEVEWRPQPPAKPSIRQRLFGRWIPS
jgi:hypothetical protein